MRPVSLIVRAFGPYAEEQIFDFRELNGRSFFLIHGPTGSGKTTLLDAICFALYGDTSGNEREGKQMRSDLAEPGRLTEVVFDFTLGTESYRVARSPEQERPKQRGEGTTTERPKATLWRRTGLDKDEEEGRVLASQWSDVTRAVEELLGFRSDQFRQVVLLPQGKFQKLLAANSTEREAIFEHLFQTRFFRTIADRLKQAAKDVQDRMKDARRGGEIARSQAGVESLEELETRRAETEGRLAEWGGRIAELRARESAALDALGRGREAARRFAERDEARAAHEAVAQRSESIAQDRVALEQARAAATLIDAEENLAAATRESEEARRGVDAARAAHAAALESLAAAASRFQDEERREPERESARGDLTRLEGLRSLVAELDLSKKALDEAAARAREAESKHEEGKAKLETLAGRIEKGTQRVAQAEKAAAELAGREAAVRETQVALQRRRRLETDNASLVKAMQQLASLRKDLADTERAFAEAREDLAQTEAAWAEGQAVLLAATLEENAPCPVCGSTDHPAPAHAKVEVPDEGRVRDHRSKVERLEKERDDLRRRESEAAGPVTELRSRVEELRADLGTRATTPIEDFDSALANAKASCDAARREAGQASRFKDLLAALLVSQTEAKSSLAEAESGLAEARRERDVAGGRVAQREADVPDDLRVPGALKAALDRAAARLRELLESHGKAREAKTTAETTAARRETERQSAEERARAAAARAESARLVFDDRLREAGFRDAAGDPDGAAFASAKSHIPKMATIEKGIRAHESALDGARDRLRRAEAALEGLTPPDLAALESAHADARAAAGEAVREQGALGQQLGQMDRWIATLRDTERRVADLDREFAVVGRLAEVANGVNPRRINFQRFVLGALLDDALVAASHRLTVMSRGRYTLQRQAERGDKRSAGGLDLEVFDAFTGIPRSAQTLSGGESFLASLSLALGLADVVQAYSGGIRLDTMFVDEGFGSLDPESLDLALRALIDLQKGGRLVGIISHVPELRDRIDARLEIMPSRRGSRARFVLP